MTAIIKTSSNAPIRVEFLGVLDAEDESTPSVCLNGGECDECADKSRCYGEDEA